MTGHNHAIPDPVARLRALQSDQTRARNAVIEQLKAIYVRLPRDEQLRAAIDGMIDVTIQRQCIAEAPSETNRLKGTIVAVVGETGAGKTTALERIFNTHPAFDGYRTRSCCLFTVSAPSPCVLKTLGRETLDVLGYKLQRDLHRHLVWERVRRQITAQKKLFVHFDEMQHVAQGKNENETRDILNTLKSLLQNNEWWVSLVLSGITDPILDLLQVDEQVWRRVTLVRFEKIDPAADIAFVVDLVSTYADKAGVAFDTTGAETWLPRLCHAALYAYGLVIERTIDAIKLVLTRPPERRVLDRSAFADAFAAKTACSAAVNPFLVANWTNITVERLLRPERDLDPQTIIPPKPPKQRRSTSWTSEDPS